MNPRSRRDRVVRLVAGALGVGQLIYVGLATIALTFMGYCGFGLGGHQCDNNVGAGVLAGGVGVLATLVCFGLVRGVLRYRRWALGVVAGELMLGGLVMVFRGAVRLLGGTGGTRTVAVQSVVLGVAVLLLAGNLVRHVLRVGRAPSVGGP